KQLRLLVKDRNEIIVIFHSSSSNFQTRNKFRSMTKFQLVRRKGHLFRLDKMFTERREAFDSFGQKIKKKINFGNGFEGVLQYFVKNVFRRGFWILFGSPKEGEPQCVFFLIDEQRNEEKR